MCFQRPLVRSTHLIQGRIASVRKRVQTKWRPCAALATTSSPAGLRLVNKAALEGEDVGTSLGIKLPPGFPLMYQHVTVAGQQLPIVIPRCVYEVMDWYEAAGMCDRDPYWSRPWPSAVALATQILLQHRWVENKSVIEVGAGIGVAGLAAAMAGASHVSLTDREELGLLCAALTAQCWGLQPHWNILHKSATYPHNSETHPHISSAYPRLAHDLEDLLEDSGSSSEDDDMIFAPGYNSSSFSSSTSTGQHQFAGREVPLGPWGTSSLHVGPLGPLEPFSTASTATLATAQTQNTLASSTMSPAQQRVSELRSKRQSKVSKSSPKLQRSASKGVLESAVDLALKGFPEAVLQFPGAVPYHPDLIRGRRRAMRIQKALQQQDRANRTSTLSMDALDWTQIPSTLRSDVVLCCDVLYEKQAVEPVAHLVDTLLKADGRLLLADPPNRAPANREKFLRMLVSEGPGFVLEESRTVKVDSAGQNADILVLSLRRGYGTDTVGVRLPM